MSKTANKVAVMLDLEVLGRTFPVQIGAVLFDWEGNTGDELLINIDLVDAYERGASLNLKEVMFWLDKKNDITWLQGEKLTIDKAFEKLKKFVKGRLVWSHYYDIYVLERTAEALHLPLPVYYRQWRDIRTLVSLAKLRFSKEEKERRKTHNALEDVLYQVEYCVEAYKTLDPLINDRVSEGVVVTDVERRESILFFDARELGTNRKLRFALAECMLKRMIDPLAQMKRYIQQLFGNERILLREEDVEIAPDVVEKIKRMLWEK